MTNDSLSYAQAVGMNARRADDHRRCPRSLDGVPYPPVMRVTQRLECGSHAASRAHDLARVKSLIRLVTWIQGVLVTILESLGNE
ncbi:hypothetical protein [Chloroflexus sp.]